LSRQFEPQNKIDCYTYEGAHWCFDNPHMQGFVQHLVAANAEIPRFLCRLVSTRL
jgi:hypothetical protein